MSGVILTGSPTPADVRARLFAICGALAVAHNTVLKTVLFDSVAALVAAGNPASGQVVTDCALTNFDLPALVAITTGATELTGAATSQRYVMRTYLLLVLFYQLQTDTADEQITALSSLWARLDELPDYFASHVIGNLRFNDSGLRGVREVRHMSDLGTENPIIWNGATYSAATYTLPVTTLRA